MALPDNPFETAQGAENWIKVVEGNDVFRETQIYPRVQRWLGTIRQGKTVADIGCGQGVCSPFVPADVKYIGVEPSVTLVDRATTKYGASDERKFIAGTAYNTGLESESVDSILSVHVWFHLDDLLTATKEAKRILKPGGDMFVVTANPLGYATWRSFYKNLSVDTEKMIRGTLDFGGPDKIDDSTFYLHSWQDFLSVYQEAGFTQPTRDSFPDERLTSMALHASAL